MASYPLTIAIGRNWAHWEECAEATYRQVGGSVPDHNLFDPTDYGEKNRRASVVLEWMGDCVVTTAQIAAVLEVSACQAYTVLSRLRARGVIEHLTLSKSIGHGKRRVTYGWRKA